MLLVEGLAISDLFFVDDVLLFCPARYPQVNVVVDILESFVMLVVRKSILKNPKLCDHLKCPEIVKLSCLASPISDL